jgi:hypothetical protein
VAANLMTFKFDFVPIFLSAPWDLTYLTLSFATMTSEPAMDNEEPRPLAKGESMPRFPPPLINLDAEIFKNLGLLDKLLTPLILLCMIGGVLIGVYVPNVQQKFDTVHFNGVSLRGCSSVVLKP